MYSNSPYTRPMTCHLLQCGQVSGKCQGTLKSKECQGIVFPVNVRELFFLLMSGNIFIWLLTFKIPTKQRANVVKISKQREQKTMRTNMILFHNEEKQCTTCQGNCFMCLGIYFVMIFFFQSPGHPVLYPRQPGNLLI